MRWLLALALFLVGCASAPSDLDRMQREIQNCILSGGHPHLGPDNTIICTQ